MKKQIRNYNKKGQEHGYQELYYDINLLIIRGNMKNGNEIGYEECHVILSKMTTFYIR